MPGDAAMSDRTLMLEDFSDKVGAIFAVSNSEAPPLALTLIEAKPLRGYPIPPSGRPPFSLVFLARDERVMVQSSYRLEQDALGAVEIFLVPVGKDARGVSYEALFN
jgi:hypothetical protein